LNLHAFEFTMETRKVGVPTDINGKFSGLEEVDAFFFLLPEQEAKRFLAYIGMVWEV